MADEQGLILFGMIIEREATNTSDDYAEGIVFFGFLDGHGGIHGGCSRVKQTVGAKAGELPLEVTKPLEYHGPDFDYSLFADIVRFFWESKRAKMLSEMIGGVEHLPGSIINLYLKFHSTESEVFLFDHEKLQKRIAR